MKYSLRPWDLIPRSLDKKRSPYHSCFMNAFVYFMTNKKDGTLYIGSTNNIRRRIEEHKSLSADGFTKKYQLTRCVYIESCVNLEQALRLEKRYKFYKRQWKMDLIEKTNPEWNDLGQSLNTLLAFQ